MLKKRFFIPTLSGFRMTKWSICNILLRRACLIRPACLAPARLIVSRLPRQRYDVAGEAGGLVLVRRAGQVRRASPPRFRA
ncbi:MAG: hypothetical protein KJ666_04030, partial [Bacteroidetes bacterium]|nr:hypothetical protein [Bacteroidota bacterium]